MATQTQSLAEKYKNILSKSPTAYNPGSKPTTSDISAQQGLMKAEAAENTAESEQLKKDLYGDSAANEGTSKQKSYLQKVFHTLGAPLYGIVGGIEALTGKGTKKGLANIPANIEEEGTAGDLLRSTGMSNIVAAPLGLALDIALDPLNWATVGTAALIPRIGYGAIKGGLSGASAGLKSSVLMKGEKLGRMVPGLVKNAFSETPEIAAKPMATAYRNLAQKAVESKDAYEGLVGTGLNEALQKSSTKVGALDRFGNYLSQTPTGSAVKSGFAYDTEANLNKAMSQDVANRTLMEPQLGSGVDSLLGKDLGKTEEWINNSSKMLPKNGVEQAQQLSTEAKLLEQQRMLVQKEISNIANGLLSGDEKSLAKLRALSPEEGASFVSSLSAYKAEVEWWDKRIAKAVLSPYGKKILDTYSKFIGLFKTAKIGGGLLGAGTNAIAGNPFMALMKGLDITDPEFFKSIKDGFKIAYGKDYSSLLKNKDLLRYIDEFPTAWTQTTGLYPGQIINGRIIDPKLIDDALIEAKKMGMIFKDGDVASAKNLTQEVLDVLARKSEKGAQSVNSTVENFLNRGQETSMISTEILRGPMGQWVNSLKDSADKGNQFANFFHWYLTRPMEMYSGVDQAYKIGTILKMVEKGVSYDELLKIAKTTAINSGDITQIPGRNMYKLKPELAVKIANDVYMDYLAMPGFVKIMRNLPIAGSPFMSFAYGMTAKVAKTALTNPAVFNKVNYGIKEISGQRSPLEKEALTQPYYAWYNRPGMLKVPFFEDNPVYLNVANMIPYYTMNIFQSAERDYKSKFGNAVAGIIDKTPFFKTPEGQVLFDYVVQPLILQGEESKGMFNQPLGLTSDTPLTTTRRGVQALTESVVPTMAGYAGLVAPWGETGEKITEYIPSYRWRQLSRAKQGKSSWGIQTKEPAMEKTARVMAAMAGWPMYQIKLTNIKSKE